MCSLLVFLFPILHDTLKGTRQPLLINTTREFKCVQIDQFKVKTLFLQMDFETLESYSKPPK